MNPTVWAIAGFLLLNLVFAFRTKTASTLQLSRAKPLSAAQPHANDAADFIVAGRSLGGFLLLATLAASNLSAFTIFGIPGAAYRQGWAFMPAMAFGTAFMAISFLVIGLPLRRLAAAGGWTTPGHCIQARCGSVWLGRLFSLLTLLYTLPYLAVQTGSAGSLIQTMTGFPRPLGAALVAGVIVLYVFRGGMRSVARTDVIQLAALLILGLSAFGIIAYKAGQQGIWRELAGDLTVPGPNARTGSAATQTIGVLAGYAALWSLANPLFPHFIQRFYAAASDKAIRNSMALYPLLCLLVFVPMSAIGVLGSKLLPGLSASASDSIFTLLSQQMAGPVWGSVFSIATLAALMSTMDSQLLSCASIVVEDFLPAKTHRARAIAWAGLALTLVAWLISLRPPANILGFLGSTAFPGYASLAPCVLAAIYLSPLYDRIAPRATGRWTWLLPLSCALSLLAGTALVLLGAAGFKPAIPAVLFNAAIQLLILVAALPFYAWRNRPSGQAIPQLIEASSCIKRRELGVALGLGTVFLMAGLDWWHVGPEIKMLGFLPVWVWYHAGLVAIMWLIFSLAAHWLNRQDLRDPAS